MIKRVLYKYIGLTNITFLNAMSGCKNALHRLFALNKHDSLINQIAPSQNPLEFDRHTKYCRSIHWDSDRLQYAPLDTHIFYIHMEFGDKGRL